MEQREVSLTAGNVRTVVQEQGRGAPLLYLHGTWDAAWTPLLDALARQHRVIAPRLPGFAETAGAEHLLDIHDLVYTYLDLLDALELRGLPIVGHSLGAMLAAELAAVQPERFTRLVLVSPLGLWNEAQPVADFLGITPAELAALLYADPTSAAAVAASTGGAMGEDTIERQIERAQANAATARFIWPIPNKGLAKRLHRARMPTLLVWGARDGVVPPAYADDFRRLLPTARVETIPDAAHLVPLEQPQQLARAIEDFLH